MNRRRIVATAAAQAGIGVSLLARPDLAARLSGADRPPVPPWLVRLLGGRMALQAAVTLARPTTTVALVGAAVDALHSASMVGVAGIDPRRARAALTSAALAAGSAALLATAARNGRQR